MTHRPIQVEADGTRVYASGHRYKPKPEAERTNGRNKPEDPRAVRFHALWFVPLEFLEDSRRLMPETRPDTDAYDHCEVTLLCGCDVCVRPQADRWRRKWRREHGSR